MKTKLHWLFIVCLMFGASSLFAQQVENKPQKASFASKMNYKYVPSIAEQMRTGTFIASDPVSDKQKMGRPKLRHGAKVVPGKGFPKGLDPLIEKQKSFQQRQMRGLTNSFLTSTSVGTPSDPTGAVGRDFYIASWNTAWQIFNKDGTTATGMPNSASLATLFGEAPGDPIVLYDSEADRYIVTQFSGSPNGFHVAVSQSNDPINDGWHVYSSTDFQTGAFPDYTKFSIWSDGYYVTANIGGGNGQVWAIERDEMLNGNTTNIQGFFLPGLQGPIGGFYSPQVFNVTDDNLPATGNATIVYLQDDAYAGVATGNDHIKLWNLDIDWTTPANSVISAAIELGSAEGVSPFNAVFDGGSFSNLSQPTGPDIDALQALIANQAQFRKFATHNSAVFNFVVDTDAGAGEVAGVRWYELRQTADGMPWTLFQEGTYVAPDGRHAWNASMAMDVNGNIGMGYSSMSTSESLSLRFTGRFDGDALGVMTGLEGTIAMGSADNPNLRYADYSQISVDPSDGETFYFVSEFFDPGRRDIVGVFTVDPPMPNDVGVISIDTPNNGVLTVAETVTVTIQNFGTNTQSSIPVSYTIDAGTPVNETYTGTLTAGATDTYVFTTTADLSVTNQTYNIVATTNLAGDALPGNDSTSKDVTNALNYCIPTATSGCGVDGIKKFILGTIDADDGGDGCNSTGAIVGYVDRKDMSTDLDRATGNNVYTLQAQHNWNTAADNEGLSVWIDLDDSGSFEVSERLISGEGFQTNNALEDFTLTIPTDAALGPHVLRAKAIDVTAAGDILDPCSDFAFGEVHDYTVNIIDSFLSVGEFTLDESEFIVNSLPDNQFEIILRTGYSDIISFSVFNLLGQQLVFNNIDKENNNEYKYDLDMSYASSGIYIVKMGRGNAFKSAKIIVK
jgi:hypothetical protein